jgi:putative ABC transport system substrate-binding protein
MRRREFITLLGGAAAASSSLWPLAARAQQGGPMRRVGALISAAESDQGGQARLAAFQHGLEKLGWTDGRNVRIDTRWGGFGNDRMRTFAAELVGLRPDVLFASGTTPLAALRQATRSIPIVFALVSDPIGGGFVASLARPGGNVTGFMATEPPLAGKWLQLLKLIAPRMTRVALLFNPEVAFYAGEWFRYADTAAAALAVELIAAAVHDETEMEGALATLAREPDGGLMVLPDAFTLSHYERIIAVAAKHHLPAMYQGRNIATAGGLVSYGSDLIDQHRQAASYVDRILRGEKPADLPVQAVTKYELVINRKTAKALGLNVSADLLSIADEVIE